MKVLKFGGSSVKDAERIKNVVKLISDDNPKIVVISALQHATNLLSDFVKQLKQSNFFSATQIINVFREMHHSTINNLISNRNLKEIALNKLNKSINTLHSCVNNNMKDDNVGTVLSQGELLSTMMMFLYMLEQGFDVALLPAVDIIKTDKYGEPDYHSIKINLNKELGKNKGCHLFITQGFISRNYKNKIDNLGRGGSDYTATIIGSVINADTIEIWTDIDGLHNNDPRFVSNTKSITNLSYETANELAYFGAKILHPNSIAPAQNYNIPIIVKNTMNPNAVGTLINHYKPKELKAIAAKDSITTIKIKSARMMQAYGFLRKIFEVFEKYQTPVDMLTTSEIMVAMTIENKTYLNEIIQDLSLIGDVETDNNQCIICVIGNYEQSNIQIQTIIECLRDIDIKMISYGASNLNLSLVVNSNDKIKALNILNSHFLKNEPCLTIKK